MLPLEGQTAQTGRLADFMVSLGLTVRERDLDYESSDDDALAFTRFSLQRLSIFFASYSLWALYILENILEY